MAIWVSYFNSLNDTYFNLYEVIAKSNKEKFWIFFLNLENKSLGPVGRVICNIAFALSQTGFVIASTVFIFQNLDEIIRSRLRYKLSHIWIGIFLICIISPLCWIKKIKVLARCHLFADIAMISTVLIIMSYGIIQIDETDSLNSDIKMINKDHYMIFIGVSAYAFEGISSIMPIKDT